MPTTMGGENRIGSDASDFLTFWFSRCPEGQFVEIRPLNKRSGKPLRPGFFESADAGLAYAKRSLAAGDDVYLGALPRVRKSGTAADVESLSWLFADIDFGGREHGHAAPSAYPTREDAYGAIASFVPEPSAVVETGGGFHVWWALESPTPADAWRDAISRVVHALNADAAATDPPRILRLPGTVNLKNGDRRPVVIAKFSERVHPIAAFLELPAVPEPAAPEPARPRSMVTGDTPFNRANDVPVAEVLGWLGVEMHREGAATYCACPVHRGHNTSQMVVGGRTNVASCFGDCGSRAYTPVDLVMAARAVDGREAVNLLAERFGFQGFPKNVAVHPTASRQVRPAWENELLRTAKGEVKSQFANVCAILRNDPKYAGRLAYNAMSLYVQLDSSNVDDSAVGHLREAIERTYRISLSDQLLREALLTVASEKAFHPLRNYLSGLRWDGEQRIDRLPYSVLGLPATNGLAARLMRLWFISAVARATRPGCQVDTALVLVGAQGAGKSSFFRVLGGEFFADSFMDIANRDGLLQLHSAWIYEWGEIERVTSSRAASEVKQFVTSPADTFRAPYGRTTAKHPRSTVIVGTTNLDRFLNDPTGARRWWIFSGVDQVDRDELTRQRDQLWAEALVRLEGNEIWYLSRNEESVREEQAREHYEDDAWEGTIESWALRPGRGAFAMSELLADALKIEPRFQDRASQNRAGAILRRLGFTLSRPRDASGMRSRAWSRLTPAP